MPDVQQALQTGGDGRRPHHPVVEARKDDIGQLPDALYSGQPVEAVARNEDDCRVMI